MKRLQLSASFLPARNVPGSLRSASHALARGAADSPAWLQRLRANALTQSRVTRMTSSSEVTPAWTQR